MKLIADSWQTIRLAYLAGGDVAQLAAQHNITEACLRKRITREKWAAEKRQLAMTVTEQTVETVERAGQRFKQTMVREFDEWFELARRQRAKIKDGDFDALNTVVNAFTRLHASAFKHFEVERRPERPLICADDFTSRAETDEERERREAIDVECCSAPA